MEQTSDPRSSWRCMTSHGPAGMPRPVDRATAVENVLTRTAPV